MIKQRKINQWFAQFLSSSNLICSFLVTLVFSFRWFNCLPFSGNMPVMKNTDNIGFWGRYIIYAQEPLRFPLGFIKNLSFPFPDANITIGSMPLFGLLFKILGKIYSPFAQFFYFPFVELLSVFFTAYFTCLLLEEFKIRSFWIKLLGSVLTGLSFPLVFRSSVFFEATIHVFYFPLFLSFAYFYVKFYKNINWKYVFSLAFVFLVAALTGYYITMALAFMFCVFLAFNFFEFLLNKTKINKDRLIRGIFSFVFGILLSNFAFFVFGNQGNLELLPSASVLIGRYREDWGYGGGFGGGFHVADVLTLIVPPELKQGLSSNKKVGPTAILTDLGFPLTTARLQVGQYEGFTYLGTTTIGILLFLFIINFLAFIQNYKYYLMRIKLKLSSKIFFSDNLFSLPIVFGIATFLLYLLSWGYIVHVGGVRFNEIPTFSLLIAMVWRKFMFARSLGRMAIPFNIFINLAMVIYLGYCFQSYVCKSNNKLDEKKKKFLIAFLMVSLSLVHVYEIRGYLKTQEIIHGNEYANLFGKGDRRLIKRLTKGKNALMVVPQPRGTLDWGKIAYGLGFYAQIPISGATIGPPGEPPEHLRQYEADVNNIINGNIQEIFDRYGPVAIALSSEKAKETLTKADIDLRSYNLSDQDVTILVPIKKEDK